MRRNFFPTVSVWFSLLLSGVVPADTAHDAQVFVYALRLAATQQRRQPAILGTPGAFISVSQLQATELLAIGRDELNANRQTGIAEAGRRGQCRAT